MEYWGGIVGAVSGALATGIIFVFRDYAGFSQNRKREKRELLIEKYESLYSGIESYSSGIGMFAIEIMGHVGFGDKIDFDGLKSRVDLGPLMMKGNFYAPEISKELEDLKTLNGKFLTTFGKIVFIDKGASDDRLEIASKCVDISQEISEKANVVCRKLSAVAEKLIHDN